MRRNFAGGPLACLCSECLLVDCSETISENIAAHVQIEDEEEEILKRKEQSKADKAAHK